MIKAQGIKAVFRGKAKHAKSCKEWVGDDQIDVPDGVYLFEKRVIAFDDEGAPLILGNRGLEPANSKSNFVGIREGDDDDVISIVPASDWVAWRKDQSGAWWPSRLCAWALMSSGSVVAMESDHLGLVDRIEDDARILHVSDGPPNEPSEQQTANPDQAKGD